MRIVLDTNVLIAAFIARGVCSALLEHCVLRHTLILSDEILNEMRDHLTGKFKYAAEDADAAVDLIRSEATLVRPELLAGSVCRDPDDDVILGTAAAGRADCIVTGDKNLLVLVQFRGIDIIRPADFAGYEAQSQP